MRPYGAREREKDPGWVWTRGSRTKLIVKEGSFVSQDRFANPSTVTEIWDTPRQNCHQINKRISREGIKKLALSQFNR